MTRLRARTVFSDEACTVTAVEKTVLHRNTLGRGCFFSGSLRPIAVIIKLQDRTYALDMAGQELELDRVELPAGFDLE